MRVEIINYSQPAGMIDLPSTSSPTPGQNWQNVLTSSKVAIHSDALLAFFRHYAHDQSRTGRRGCDFHSTDSVNRSRKEETRTKALQMSDDEVPCSCHIDFAFWTAGPREWVEAVLRIVAVAEAWSGRQPCCIPSAVETEP